MRLIIETMGGPKLVNYSKAKHMTNVVTFCIELIYPTFSEYIHIIQKKYTYDEIRVLGIENGVK